jgi:hypothetical protein
MQGPLTNLINNLKGIQRKLDSTVDQEVRSNLDEFEDMQRERLDKGINKDGSVIKKENVPYYPYSPSYTRQKRAFGGQTKVVDLKGKTGNFRRQITAQKYGKGKVNIYSRDSKEQKLEKDYGTKLFGFTPDQKQEIQMNFKRVLTITARTNITNRRAFL